MIYTSLEVRWFFEGAVAPDFAHWFTTVGQTEEWNEAERRTDTYLCIPSVDDMGVKIRHKKKLEFKGRQELLGVSAFSDLAQGVFEKWTKWSYAASDGVDELVRRLGTLNTVNVGKHAATSARPSANGLALQGLLGTPSRPKIDVCSRCRRLRRCTGRTPVNKSRR